MINVLLIGCSIAHVVSPAMVPQCYYQSGHSISNFSVTTLAQPILHFTALCQPARSTLSAPLRISMPILHITSTSRAQPSPNYSISHIHTGYQPTTTSLFPNNLSQSHQNSEEGQSSTRAASHHIANVHSVRHNIPGPPLPMSLSIRETANEAVTLNKLQYVNRSYPPNN